MGAQVIVHLPNRAVLATASLSLLGACAAAPHPRNDVGSDKANSVRFEGMKHIKDILLPGGSDTYLYGRLSLCELEDAVVDETNS